MNLLIKKLNMKIGIFTITLNRLYYNYHCLKSLKNNAVVPFEQIIVDNGSTDGSYEWLKEEGFNVIRNEENKGISFASKQGYDWLVKKGIDIIIKVDSDCEFISPSTLEAINEFFSVNALQKEPSKYVVSPVVKGITNSPPAGPKEVLGKFNIQRIGYIGGIFRAMRIQDFTEAMSQSKGLNDKPLNAYFTANKFKVGYMSDLIVNHFETTKGQEKRYPEYFNKEYIF